MTFQIGYDHFTQGLPLQGADRRDPEALAGWEQAKRDHKLLSPERQAEIRAERFGDANYDSRVGQRLLEEDYVHRYLNGLPLGRHGAKEARRIIRERKAEGNNA